MAAEMEAKGAIFGRSAAKEGTENGEGRATETKRTPDAANGRAAQPRWRWMGGEVEKEAGADQAMAIVSSLSLTSFSNFLPFSILLKPLNFSFFSDLCGLSRL